MMSKTLCSLIQNAIKRSTVKAFLSTLLGGNALAWHDPPIAVRKFWLQWSTDHNAPPWANHPLPFLYCSKRVSTM